MPETLLFLLEIIGTVAFSVSGAIVGLRKNMDIFGVAILGLTTAVGGGIIRDIILGITPPVTFVDPTYAMIAILVAIITFFSKVRKFFERYHRFYDAILLIMDSLGLGVFTVIGIRTAYKLSDYYNIFLLLFVGIVTGVGGGVIRDVLAGDRPYIFIKDFYACASMVGGLFSIGMWHLVGETWAMLLGIAVIVLLRLAASYFHWKLPSYKSSED